MAAANRPPSSSSPTEPPPRSPWVRWLPALLLLAAAISFWTGRTSSTPPNIEYSSFYALVEQGKVAKVSISGQDVKGTLKAAETVEGHSLREFHTRLPQQEDRDLLPLLRTQKVEITVEGESGLLAQAALSILPWVVIMGGWVWMSRRAQRMAGNPFGIGSSSHRVERQDSIPVRFDDIAGLASAKRDLQEVVQFLREPDRFQRLGGKLPRGVMLVGPPGTGKTLLARAVAGEAGVPFFYVNGSEFIQLFVGVGASRVRDLFAEAKKVAPSIIFIDEIDAVGRSRGTGLGGGNDEREQTLNQLLSELDGFTRNDRTVVLAATNRPDVLDSALLRPGRFDRRIVIDRPELKAREAILRVHTKDKPLAPDVSLPDLAANTPGFSGADLANLANEAALNATRRGADNITASDFATAMDKITLGDPRETLLGPEEKRRVAVHESGHAVVARFTPRAEALRRVSILPRGMALGATQQSPAPDRHLMTQPELEARLRVLMGGYAAESILFGDVSSGSENDLKVATDIAFNMVAHFGMSDRVGPVFHEVRTEHPFLGQRLATDTGLSDATAHQIEEETRRVLNAALAAAKGLIAQRRDVLDRLVAGLLEHETLELPEIDRIIGPEVPT